LVKEPPELPDVDVLVLIDHDSIKKALEGDYVSAADQ